MDFGFVLFFFSFPVVLCMLQCGINTLSDHPRFEAIVFGFFFFPRLYFLICTLTLVSVEPLSLISVGEICSVSWMRSKFW